MLIDLWMTCHNTVIAVKIYLLLILMMITDELL
jgi:hypothetical protein